MNTQILHESLHNATQSPELIPHPPPTHAHVTYGTQGIDFDRPMWEWEVVSKPDTGQHLLLVRVHHGESRGIRP